MSNYIAVEVPALYPYVLLMTGATNFLCLIVGFCAGGKRRTIFNREFMQQFDTYVNAGENAMNGSGNYVAGGKEVPAGGYPDLGNGLYGM